MIANGIKNNISLLPLIKTSSKAGRTNHACKPVAAAEIIIIINAIKIDPEWNDQAARKKLLTFINSHDLNSEDAKKARRQLSSILFH